MKDPPLWNHLRKSVKHKEGYKCNGPMINLAKRKWQEARTDSQPGDRWFISM